MATDVKTTDEIWGVVGYRYFTDRAKAFSELDKLVASRGKPIRVVSGGATGADTLAEDWAKERGVDFVKHLPKGVNEWGIATAKELLARNTLIAVDCTFLVAFVSDASRGTHDTIKKAAALGKKTHIVRI